MEPLRPPLEDEFLPEIQIEIGLPRQQLIEARLALGLSRPDLALILGITRHYVWRVEVGDRAASPALMERWASALGHDLRIWPRDDLIKAKRKYARLMRLEGAISRSAA